MTTPHLEEDGVLREWSPLTRFLKEIPQRSRRGFFFEQVKLTCVDAVNDCLAVGTNSGTVYWYDRTTNNVLVLTPEKTCQSITCVKLASSVDFMVAAGDVSGVVTIFRVPKPPPDWIPVEKRNFNDKVERYTVSGIHKGPVSALEWSINGQKLFSGDSKGIVVYTEIDFCMNLSKAREILNESYSVVQLSYSQSVKALLVSTVFRCIICYRQQQDSVWKVVQVGQKERSSLLGLGGVFYTVEGGPPEPFIYSCRPGLRLWQANLDGVVQQTVLYKEAVKNCNNPVKLLKAVKCLTEPEKQLEFGCLLPWRDGLFVSYSSHSLLVLDPSRVVVVATLLNVKDLISVSTTRNEIFIICGDRDLVRLSYTPDSSDGPIGDVATGETVSSLPHFTPSPIVGTNPIVTDQQSNKFPLNTPDAVLCANEVIYGTDTASLPPIVALHEGIVELRIDLSRLQKLNEIGEQEFDDIIYSRQSKEKTRKRSKKSTGSAEVKHITPEPSIADSDSLRLYDSFDSVQLDNCLRESEVPTDILPDFRSLDSIVEDVKQKELLLEANLVLPVSLPLQSSEKDTEEFVEEEVCKLNDEENEPDEKAAEGRLSSFSHSDEATILESKATELSTLEANNLEDILGTLPSEEPPLSEQQLVVQVRSSPTAFVDIPLEEVPLQSSFPSSSPNKDDMDEFYQVKEFSGKDSTMMSALTPAKALEVKSVFEDWEEISCPDKPISLSATSNKIILCTPNFTVYIGTYNFESDEPGYWQKLDYKAQQVYLSRDGQIGCKVYCGIAHYSRDWEDGRNWSLLCRGAESMCLSNEGIWYISSGELLYFSFSTELAVAVPCGDKVVTNVCAVENNTVIVCDSGKMFFRDDKAWRRIPFRHGRVIQVSLGPRNLLWAVCSEGGVFLTESFTDKKPYWWQVTPGDLYLSEFNSVCTTDESIIIGDYLKNTLFVNCSSVLGFNWEDCRVDVPKPLQLTSEGVFEDKGSIWIWTDTNQIACLQPFTDYLEVECNVVCLASAPQVLWILTDEGKIFIRNDISDAQPSGSEWKELNLDQINKKTQLAQISCGCDVVWACDIRGNILMLVGSPHSIASDPFPPAWVNVDGGPILNNTFTKVFVGPQSHMVWALDNAGNVYVREAIFPDFLIGTGWVHVPGVRASHLSISDEAVWALGKEGIYKRLGISQSNYIGESWHFLPCSLDHLSASVSEGLWGISCETGRLVSYCSHVIPISSQAYALSDWMLL